MIKFKNVYLGNFILGILAGMAIAIGGLLNIVCLTFGQKILGGILFSVGLITVCFFGLHLYTGKFGYILENNRKYYISLLIMLLGNFVGAVLFGYFLRLVGLHNGECANTIAAVSLKKTLDLGSGTGQPWWKMFVLSFMCCNLVFLAVDIYKKNKNWLVKLGGILICVPLFVILGMEHCVADMFYLAVGNRYFELPLECITALFVSIAGNSLGAVFFYLVINKSSLAKKI